MTMYGTCVKYSFSRQSAHASDTPTGLHSLLMSHALMRTCFREETSAELEKSKPRRTRELKSPT